MESQFAQVKGTQVCYCCGKTGHMSPDCPEKDKRKKSDWAMIKAMSAYQQDTTKKIEEVVPNDVKTSDPSTKEKSNKTVKWASTFQTKQGRKFDQRGIPIYES